jgi:hypothetical protein
MSALPLKADIDLKSPFWVTGKERAFAQRLTVWRGVDCGIPTAMLFHSIGYRLRMVARSAQASTQFFESLMNQSIIYAIGAMICYGFTDFIYKQGTNAGIRAEHFLMVQGWCFLPLVILYALATHSLVLDQRRYGVRLLAPLSSSASIILYAA